MFLFIRISAIRERVWLVVIVIAFAILAFLLMDIGFGGGKYGGAGSQITSGYVNGEPINQQEYSSRISNAVEQSRAQNPNMTEEQRLRTEESAWQQYLTELVTKEEFKKLGIGVGLEETRGLLTGTKPHRYMMGSQQFLNEQGQFDPSRVKAFDTQVSDGDDSDPQVQRLRTSWRQFKNSVREDQHFQKYGNLVKKSVYVPSWQAELLNQEDGRKVDFQYVKVPYTSIDYSIDNISDADLSTYLSNNASTYKMEENVSFDFVVFDVAPSQADIEATRTELQNLQNDFRNTQNDSSFVQNESESDYTGAYLLDSEVTSPAERSALAGLSVGQVSAPFQDGDLFKMVKVVDQRSVPDSVQCSHILIRENAANPAAAKTTVDSIYTAIRAGGDWDRMASLFSADKANAENGGSLNWAKKKQMVGPFNDKLFYDGSQPGQIKRVKTQFGWHIIRIDDIATSKIGKKLAVLSKTVLPSSETSKNLFNQAADFSGSVTAANFAEKAEAAGLTVQNAYTKTKNDFTVPGIGANTQAITWGFQSDVGEVSSVIDTGEKLVVAVLKEKNAAGVPPLSSIRNQVQSAFLNQKKTEIVSANGFGDLAAAASKYGVSTQNATGVSFASRTGLPTDLSAEDKVQAVAFNSPVNKMSKAIQGRTGVFFIQVSNVVDAPATSDYSSLAGVKTTAARSNADGRAVQALKNAADIEDTRYQIRNY